MTRGIFHFRQFHVAQTRSSHKVGTDGILLGSWSKAPQYGTILDIGTGTGLLSMMLAQRTEGSAIAIDAIEIDPHSAQEATENFRQCRWSRRLKVVNGDFLNWNLQSGLPRFDLIVANPPFFDSGSGSDDSRRFRARHSSSLPIRELIHKSATLLRSNGRLSLIFPASRYAEVRIDAENSGLFLRRQLNVKPMPQSGIKRILCEFSREPSEIKFETMHIEDSRHNYSSKFQALTREFYLPSTFRRNVNEFGD